MGCSTRICAGAVLLATPFLFAQTPVNPDADRAVVGGMDNAQFALLQQLPLPSSPNQKFCSLLSLGADLYAYAYVPTAAERKGDFSRLASPVIDPVTGQPFPGNIIPASRLPETMAMRISALPPGPTENCRPAVATPKFQVVNSVTGYGPSDQINIDNIVLFFNYRGGDPAVPQTVTVTSGSPNKMYWAVADEYPTNLPALAPTEPWVSVNPRLGAAPSSMAVTIKPGDLLPGSYSTGFRVVPVAVNSPPRTVTVLLNYSVPATWLQIQRPDPNVVFVVGQSDPPDSKVIQIKSLGTATAFAAEVIYVSPPSSAGVNWLNVSPAGGSSPRNLTVSFNQSELSKFDRGTYLAFIRITAPGAPNSPQIVPMVLSVFPDADFTVTSDNPIEFDYTPGGAPATKPIGLDPVPNPILNTAQLSFKVTATTEDGRNWLTVSPGTFTGIPRTLTVSLNPIAMTGLSANQYHGWVSLDDGSITGAQIPVTMRLADAGQADVVTTRVIAQVVDGQSWKTFITLMNTDQTKEHSFKLVFHRGRRAVAQNLEFESRGVIPSLEISDTIPAGGSIRLTTAGTSSQLWEGWAELQAVDAIDGTAIFRVTQSAAQDSEGAVPLRPLEGTRFLLPFDNSGSAGQRYDTGFALLNSSTTSTATVQVTVRNENGQTVGPAAAPIVLGPLEHMAFSLPGQVAATAGIRGVAEFKSDGAQIAGLGLRFSPKGNFTSFQTISGGSTATQRLTHIADGSGWKTSVILVNPDGVNPVSVQVGFKAGLNTPSSRSLPLVGRSYAPGSTFTVSIPPASAVTLESQGNASDPLWMGWAEMNPSGPLSGFAVFRGDRSGIESEGAVPMLSGASSKFYMPFDNTNGVVTSVAMVNSGSSVGIVFRSEAGSPISTYSMSVQGHTAFELNDPQFQVQGTRGVAEFTSDGGDLLGLGLRFNDPRRAFTSVPVVRK